MMYQSYKHKSRTSGSSIWTVAFWGIVVVFGGLLVYQLIQWFRTSNETTALEIAASATVVSSPFVPSIVDGSATIYAMDGGVSGTMYRRGDSTKAEYNTILSLPVLVSESSYEVWMVKPGLSDAQSAGILDFRADGTYAKVFSFANPALYSTVVIMLEPNDGMTTPSGNIVAKGEFPLNE